MKTLAIGTHVPAEVCTDAVLTAVKASLAKGCGLQKLITGGYEVVNLRGKGK